MYVYILDYGAKSIDELYLDIDELYLNGELDSTKIEETLEDDYGYNLDEIDYMYSYRRLTLNFITKTEKIIPI